MSEEEDFKKLEELKKQKQEAYAKFKGFLEGVRMSKLNSTEQGFLRLLELMIDGFQNIQDDMIISCKSHLLTIRRLNDLEARIKQLEETLGKFEEWK